MPITAQLVRSTLRRPRALARRCFDRAATPLRAELHQLFARVGAHTQVLESAIASIGAAVAANTSALEALRRELRERERHAGGIEATLTGLSAIVNDHQRQLSVRTTNDWVHHLSLTTAPLVSVIMPTRDRAEVIARAIASVQGQSYTNWELVIVDDGSVDGTPAILDALTDERVRSFRDVGRGCCAARNIGLRQARGSIIAYLDDDNVMHPDWLKAVVWGFEQRPDSDVLYGAFVVDNTARVIPNGAGTDLPHLYWHAYDHHRVLDGNVADMGALAHRAGLLEAHFDESLREMGDWDILLRLTRAAPPFQLPAIACFYTTDAAHRLSGGPSFTADADTVRAKNRRAP